MNTQVTKEQSDSSNSLSRTYSPASPLKHPRQMAGDMWKDLVASQDLAITLALRDIKALYRQSMLGYAWAVLPPLAATLVFTLLRSGGAFKTAGLEIPYPVFVILGTLVWQVIVDAVMNPLRLVTSNRSMLTKINFPRESLILAGLVVALFSAAVRIVLLIPMMIWLGQSPSPAAFLLPVGVFTAAVFGSCIGLMFAPIGMLYKDVEKAVAMLTGFFMFLTPVVIPIATEGKAATIMKWNPATPIVECSRRWFVGAPDAPFGNLVLVLGLSLLALLVGWVLYRVAMPHAIARMGM